MNWGNIIYVMFHNINFISKNINTARRENDFKNFLTRFAILPWGNWGQKPWRAGLSPGRVFRGSRPLFVNFLLQTKRYTFLLRSQENDGFVQLWVLPTQALAEAWLQLHHTRQWWVLGQECSFGVVALNVQSEGSSVLSCSFQKSEDAEIRLVQTSCHLWGTPDWF